MNLIQAVKNIFSTPTPENTGTSLSFGDPVSGVDISHTTDYYGTFYNNYIGYYVPPISPSGLVSLMQVPCLHGRLVHFKKKTLLKYLVTNSLITRETAKKLALDYFATGNAYLKLTFNRLGQAAKAERVPAVNMRVVNVDNPDKPLYGYLFEGNIINFDNPNEIIWHWKCAAPDQDIYGIPEWAWAIQIMLLNENNVLFSRRFYKNGAHIGNLIVTSGMLPKEETVLKSKLESGEGVGNFRTAHLGLPGGDISKAISVIPLGQITDIDKTKLRSANNSDILAAHGIRAELAGIAPQVVGGSGDLEKIAQLYYEHESIYDQDDFLQLNDFLPTAYKIRFNDDNGLSF
jgi:capsid portal protein